MRVKLFGKIQSKKCMKNLFGSTYKGKRVLITGHTGFKGSWLTLWLTKLGAEVIGYSKDVPTNPNHFGLLKLKIISIKGDILDKKKLFRVIKRYKPDIIFHLAAQALVGYSYINPVETFETNIMGSINIFEACRKLGKRISIVNITSDKCYQNNEKKEGYKEDDPLGGDDPYSASKGAVEIVSNSYRKSFFPVNKFDIEHHILLSNARAGNVIGGGDWGEYRLIPDIVKATHQNKKTLIRNPQSIRPWQHVLEPLSGYLQIGQKLLQSKKEYADNWNFGPNNKSSMTVNGVVKQAKIYWNKINYEILENKSSFHETNMLKLDSIKARKKLEWKSVWDSKTTIEKTINWYKKYYDEKIILSEKDLEEYINDAKKLSVNWTKL